MIKHKGEAIEKFKAWKTLVESQTRKKIKRLQIDVGLKCCLKEFDRFCRDNWIKQRSSVQGGGEAELVNVTLVQNARKMISQSGLKRSFWAEAVNSACYLMNRTPAAVVDYRTPFELWT